MIQSYSVQCYFRTTKIGDVALLKIAPVENKSVASAVYHPVESINLADQSFDIDGRLVKAF